MHNKYNIMGDVGKYHIKPFSGHRKNFVLLGNEGKKKRAVHGLIEVDVTKALKLIKEHSNKKKVKISFTGWIVKCVAKTLTEHKELNAYRLGRNKIVYFDDVDVSIVIERKVGDEYKPLPYIIRKANEKSILEITEEIRKVQKQSVENGSSTVGIQLSRLERFILSAPNFVKKLMMLFLRYRGKLKKKHMGTVGVTAIGMKGKFPGWGVPIGGFVSLIFAIGGIDKKPGVVNDKIEIRNYLHVTLTVDHDLIDGSPLARLVSTFIDLIEDAYGLSD